MNYSYYNTLQKLCYKITELQAYFAFILLNLLSNQLAAKRGQERPREARNPNLDSDQRIPYYACTPCL